MILENLTVALKNKYDTEFRDGIHVSDLTLCIRKSIFRRLEPTPITMKELNFFTSGRAIHAAIQELAQANPAFEMEKEVKYEGIQAHIDLYDSEHNIPIECKSSRTKEVKAPKGFHLEQLKAYMAMTNATKGLLLYQCLMNFEDKPFVEFEIEQTQEQNKKTLQLLLAKAEDYSRNLENKTPMLAENVFDNPDMNWLCVNRDGTPNCPYYDQCKGAKQ